MTVDFRNLLSKPLDDVKRPEAIPGGTYFGRIKGFELLESTERKTPFVRYDLIIESAGQDIAPETLVGIDLSKKRLRKDFYLTEDAYYRIKEFAESCGIPTAGRTLDEILPETQNQSVMFNVTVDMNKKDPTAPPYNNIGDIKGVQN